nr:zinc knuckle CX2CX4HX4C [Tanacetum cinerariifolium]
MITTPYSQEKEKEKKSASTRTKTFIVCQKDTITLALVWVKLHHVPLVAFSEGRNTYAQALIEVSSLTPLMESVVVDVPYPDGSAHSLKTTDVEYE